MFFHPKRKHFSVTEKEVRNIKNNSNGRSVTINDFLGIDRRRSHSDPCGTQMLVNFRHLPDGSICRREGTRFITIMEEDVRAVWTGKLWDGFRYILLAGNCIYELDIERGEALPLIEVNTSEGDAELFYYRENLYLVDGTGIYTVRSGWLGELYGYVPLRAKGWSDNAIGELYQPRNLLNNKARFDYVISSEATSILRVDAPIIAVDAVKVNGARISSDRYSIGTYQPYVSVMGLSEGDRVSVYAEYRDAPKGLAALKRCTRGTVFGGISNSRPFLFGGYDKSLMFSSQYVSADELAASREVYTDSDAMYFPEGYQFQVGDGQYPISTVSRHFDRLLIFTEGGVWRADSESCGTDYTPIMNVNMGVCVASSHGAALLGNSPCAVGKDGIYRFASNTDELDDCNAYKISDGIAPLLTQEFLSSAEVWADGRGGRLIFSAPHASDKIFVYTEEGGKWSIYEGIVAERFFETKDGIGFMMGNEIFVFDENRATDSGAPFTAYFEGALTDMGSADKKRLSSVEICFDGEPPKCTLCLDGRTVVDTGTDSLEGGTHTRYRRRAVSRRFDCMVPRIEAEAGCGRIHSLTVNVK